MGDLSTDATLDGQSAQGQAVGKNRVLFTVNQLNQQVHIRRGKGYSYLPNRDPGFLIRTGGSIPPWFFYSDDFFSFLDPVGFIWTVVFQKCLVMFL